MAFIKGQSGNSNGRPKGCKSKVSTRLMNEKVETMLNYFKSFEDNNCYYVYGHFNPITNECFYIGKGKNGRAFEKMDGCRNEIWSNYIKSFPNYEIRLFVTGLKEHEAFNIETVLIQSRNPRCNIHKIL
jgi:hypothetical protein